MNPLAVCHRDGDAIGDLALGHDAVDLDGVLIEEQPQVDERLRKCDGVHRRELAVYLHYEVHVVADGLPGGGDQVACCRYLPGEGHVLVAVRQRVELDGGEALLGSSPRLGCDRVRGAVVGHQQVQADSVPAPATQQVPHRRPVVLALDVPEGDVHRADSARQRGAPEGHDAVVGLPVVLDAERVLPYQVRLQPPHDALHGLRVAPARRLTQPRQPQESVWTRTRYEVPMRIDSKGNVCSIFMAAPTLPLRPVIRGYVNKPSGGCAAPSRGAASPCSDWRTRQARRPLSVRRRNGSNAP